MVGLLVSISHGLKMPYTQSHAYLFRKHQKLWDCVLFPPWHFRNPIFFQRFRIRSWKWLHWIQHGRNRLGRYSQSPWGRFGCTPIPCPKLPYEHPKSTKGSLVVEQPTGVQWTRYRGHRKALDEGNMVVYSGASLPSWWKRNGRLGCQVPPAPRVTPRGVTRGDQPGSLAV
jgi:hypothetical protein